MPIPIKAYSCQFKCGERVQTRKYRMVRHEKQCYKNPENKTCITCQFNVADWETPYLGHVYGEATWGIPYKFYYCEVDHKQPELQFITDCPLWQLKTKKENENN